MSNDRGEDSKPSGTEGAEGGQDTPQKVIKRYSNRKLYDTSQSKYVTLDEIASMIKAGEELQIIDNETKEDLTSVTLTQIIYEQEKRENRMPLAMLRNLIQTGGATLHGFFDRSLKTPVAEIKDTAEHRVEELRKSAVSLRDAATKSVSDLTDSARRLFSREERRSEDFRRATSSALDELAARIDLRIAEVGQHKEHTAAESNKSTPSAPTSEANKEKLEESFLGVLRRTKEHVEILRARWETIDEKLSVLHSACAPDGPLLGGETLVAAENVAPSASQPEETKEDGSSTHS